MTPGGGFESGALGGYEGRSNESYDDDVQVVAEPL